MPAAKAHAAQLAGNVLPHDWRPGEDGYSEEEWKMIRETRKIMGDDTILVYPTTARVPVRIGHSEAINLEFHRPITVEQARQALRGAPGVVLMDDPARGEVPLPLAAARLLALRKPAGAVAVLLDYLPFAEDETLSDEVQATLASLAWIAAS